MRWLVTISPCYYLQMAGDESFDLEEHQIKLPNVTTSEVVVSGREFPEFAAAASWDLVLP